MDTNTLHQYDLVTDNCQDLFVKKNQDYGTSWTILRPSSITDQIFIKAARLRSIEEKKQQLVDDEISGDYIGIINYCIMALIQLDRTSHEYISDLGNVVETYEVKRSEVRDLMMRKNHDYGGSVARYAREQYDRFNSHEIISDQAN